MGTLQTDYSEEVRERMLHVRQDWTKWEQLAYGTYVGKGKCGCKTEIRFTDSPTTMFNLQSILRRTGCVILQENARNRRRRLYGEARERQERDCESIRLLLKLIKRI